MEKKFKSCDVRKYKLWQGKQTLTCRMKAVDGRVNSCPWMWKVTSGIWGISSQLTVYWEQRERRKSIKVSKFGFTVKFSTLLCCILFNTRLQILIHSTSTSFLALTSPFLTVTPTKLLMLSMSLWGPMTKDVPVSTIAWQPPLQATTWPLIVILRERHSMHQIDLNTLACNISLVWKHLERPWILYLWLYLSIVICQNRWLDRGIQVIGAM